MTEFVEFFHPFVGPNQVTKNWRRLGLTIHRHPGEIRNTNDTDGVANLNWLAGYVFAREGLHKLKNKATEPVIAFSKRYLRKLLRIYDNCASQPPRQRIFRRARPASAFL